MNKKLENGKRTIANIPIKEIVPYEDYPFIIDEREIFNLALSIKKNGLLAPGAVRKKGDRYELLSGHKRLKACELCKIESFPCEILNLSNKEAANYVIESNRQRCKLLPSERARLYRLKIGQAGNEPDEIENIEYFRILADDTKKVITRLLHIDYLIQELLDRVDSGEIGIYSAYELSFISPNIQKTISEVMIFEETTPTYAQAKRLRSIYESGELTEDAIRTIIRELKPNQKEQFTINKERIRNLVPEGKGRVATTEYILEALRLYKVFKDYR